MSTQEMSSQADFRERAKTNEVPIARLIGFEAKDIADGRAMVVLAAGPQHANPMGTLHGGVLCDIAEGSIKGDVKRKHFSFRWRGRSFLISSPCMRRQDSVRERASRYHVHRTMPNPQSFALFRAASSRLQAAWWQLPTMVLSETRGLLLCWVVRGSIRCPVRLCA